jgi:hypothetical protein
MTDDAAFYEEDHDLGEVVSNGMRYRVFYDPNRHQTISVLVPGQDIPFDSARSARS